MMPRDIALVTGRPARGSRPPRDRLRCVLLQAPFNHRRTTEWGREATMTPRTFGASDTPTAHTASSGGPVSPQRAWCRSIDLASARSWWARRSSLLDHLITSRSTWFTAPCRRLAPSLALLRRYRLAPSPRGSAALLRRSVSVGFPQYPRHLLAVFSVSRPARRGLIESVLVT